MSKLPEWLWPLEDEEAVQEAERLIEETHNVLQRMEADIKVQQIISQDVAFKTEKLKSEVNNKIQILEKELQGFSEEKKTEQPLTGQCMVRAQKPKEAFNKSQLKENAPVRFSGLSSNFSKTQRDTPKTHNTSLSKSHKTYKPKETVHVAEKVVLSARSKVEDALTVARNVAASLDQRLSSSSLPSKPLAYSQAANVGVFEVKSKVYEKITPAPKQRLKQADLFSVSIKRDLDMQSIPTVQISPGSKLIPANALVYNIKYNDEDEGKTQCPTDTDNSKKPECASKEHHSSNFCSALGVQSAIAELSKQLAQVEELREVNQAQVNHVLQFLVSRVCTTASPSEQCNKTFVRPADQVNTLMDETLSLPSTSSSSSGSSNYPIAYDSLSRFLETYKRAAEQNMVARSRAVSRRQKVASKQRKDIEKAIGSRAHHLLIGPLRQTPGLSGTGSSLSERDNDDVVLSKKPFVSSQRDDSCLLKDDNTNSNNNEQSDASSNKQDCEANSSSKPIEDSGHSSLVDLPPKTVDGLTGDEYEDDWEEEEDLRERNEPVPDVQAANIGELSLEPILEVEEHLSSMSYSVNPHAVSPELPLDSEKSTNEKPIKMIGVGESKTNLEEQTSDVDQPTILSNREISIVKPISEVLGESPILNAPLQASVVQSESVNQGPGSEAPTVLETFVSHEKSVNIASNAEKSKGQHRIEDIAASVDSKEACTSTSYPKIIKGKEQHSIRKRAENRHLRLSGSSSDTESKSPSWKIKHRDLRLRDDLQLQSAILLNWQLEDRWRSRNKEGLASVREQPQSQENAFVADVERRWQRTLDQLDQRLKTIEDSERINRVAHEIRMQAREDLFRVPVIESKKNLGEVECLHIKGDILSTIDKAPTKDQMIQTSPDKINTVDIDKGKQYPVIGIGGHHFQSNGLTENRVGGHHFRSNHLMSSQVKVPSLPLAAEDLTAELLTYSKMGILPRQEFLLHSNSKSPPSSTSSSQLQQSSFVVSCSDGELQGSVSGSCSCSDGEFCFCGGRTVRSERAPPDGSQTLSDGENVFRDVSQGEIPFSDAKNILGDTSNGEIADHSSTSLRNQDLDADDGLESDSIEWD